MRERCRTESTYPVSFLPDHSGRVSLGRKLMFSSVVHVLSRYVNRIIERLIIQQAPIRQKMLKNRREYRTRSKNNRNLRD